MNKTCPIIRFAIAAVSSLCLAACSTGQSDISDFRRLPETGWVYGDTLNFTPVYADSSITSIPVIVLRHNNAYLYSNLWVEIAHRNDTATVACDTINIRFADIYGRWQGRGFGVSYQLSDTLNEFPPVKSGETITLRHIMRVDTLRDIEQIGIVFVPIDEQLK